jgi:hypothetical protein
MNKVVYNVVLMGEWFCKTMEVDKEIDNKSTFWDILNMAEQIFGKENVVTVQYDHEY